MKIEVYKKTLEFFVKDGYEIFFPTITHECPTVDDLTFSATLVKTINLDAVDELDFKFSVPNSRKIELEYLLDCITKIQTGYVNQGIKERT